MDLKLRFQIREYIVSRLHSHGDLSAIGDDDLIFTSARLDSLDAVELVIFLESNFGIDFAKLNFDLTLLNSINAIVELISTRPAAT